MKSRRAQLQLTYNGADISKSIAQYSPGISFTDNAEGTADDLSVSLEDRENLWKQDWLPTKGARVTASILCSNWFAQGDSLKLPCGTFEIDEIDLSVGRGDTVTLKAVSSLVTNSLRREKKSRAWENVRLSTIAADIAANHGLTLQFQGNDASYTRIDQREESDLAVIKRLAEDEGNHVKLSDVRIIIYAGSDYDRHPVSFTISRGDSNISSVSIRSKVTDIYRGATVKYHDPSDKTLKTYTFTPPNPPIGGQVLQINSQVESIAQAMRLAKSRLRLKNKMEITGTINLMGDPRITAAMNVQLAKFGNFSGTYFIEKATHAIDRSGGYTTSLNVRKVLEY